MMNALLAIAQNDLRLRMRRWITGLVVLLVVIITWQVIPDPSSGSALIAVDNARVIYDSQTIAIGSVTFASLFFSLFAVYLVRGQSAHEVQHGVGVLLATTPISNRIFLIGRWLGAMAYLVCLILIFILTLFVLHALRGEAPLEPGVYFTIILGTLLPLCAFTASMALFCDAIPALQGRAGDVLYFLLWMAQMSLISQMDTIMSANPHLLILDGNGMVTLLSKFETLVDSKSLSIGGGEFNAALPPITIQSAVWTSAMTWTRVQTFFVMSTPLWLAIAFFHRYDPAKLRQQSGHKKTSWWRRFNTLLRPFSHHAAHLLPRTVNLPTTPRIIANEILLSVIQNPTMPMLLIVCWFLQSVAAIDQMDGAMAISFACAGVFCADIAARHQQVFCDKMRNAIAGVNEWTVWQQFLTILIICSLFLLPSLLRFIELASLRTIALPIGLILITGMATLLAMLTNSGKAFTVILLFALYVFINAGALPLIDLAGMHGAINSSALQAHTLLAVTVLMLIEGGRRWQLKSA